MITPSYPSKFPIPEFFWETESPPTKIFCTVRKTTFDKFVIHHLVLFFSDPELFWNKRVPLRLFSVLRDEKISRENRNIPFLSIKFFDKRNFLRNKGFPYEIFRYCEKINFRQNRDTPSYEIFLIHTFSETQGSPYENFRYCETKKFREKIVISPSYP